MIAFKKLHSDAKIPFYASEEAAGMDICSIEDKSIDPNSTEMIKTGLSVAISKGFELQVRPRSGLAFKYGITVINSPGTIDSDYRGEICVLLHNLGKEGFCVLKGDRIAQLVLNEVPRHEIIEAKYLDNTNRGIGGFGSTGRK